MFYGLEVQLAGVISNSMNFSVDMEGDIMPKDKHRSELISVFASIHKCPVIKQR